MKNKKLLILIPALTMVLGGCKKTDEPKPGNDTNVSDVVHPESVSLNVTELAMDLGSEDTLTPTVAPVNASDTSVTWSSDHPEIVEVSNRGKLTAKAEGTATITVTTVDGGKTAQCVVTVTKAAWGTEEEPINITQVLALAEEKLTTAKATSKDPAYIEGYVISCSEGTSTEGVKFASNIYLADSKDETERAKKLLVYSADYNPNKSINALYPGDKIVVKGYVQQYAYNATDTKDKWTLEVTKAENLNPAILAREAGKSAVTLGNHDHATVTGLPTAAVNNGTDFEFEVVADQGYTISEVTYNGEAATPVEGKANTYKAKVVGPTSIIVSAVGEGVVIKKAEITSPNNGTNLSGPGINDAAVFGLDGHFVVEGIKGEASTNVGLNAEIRLNAYYNSNPDANKAGKNNQMVISGIGITFTSIALTITDKADQLEVLVNDQVVTGDNGTYVINASSFTLKNAYAEGKSKTQIKITKIVMNYTEDPRVPATGIDLDKSAVTLKPELSELVKATVSPADSNDIVTWTSDNEAVAKVVNGKITAVAVGNCKVTATAGDFSKEVAVTVEAYPTYANLTGETYTPKAEYVDSDGKGVAKTDCVLAGYVTEFTNAYGNGWLRTVDGVRVQLYNTFDICGNGYKDMTDHKPVAGDFVVLKGENVDYSGPELKNGVFLQVNDYKCVKPAVTEITAPANPVEVNVGATVDLMKLISIAPKGADTTGIAFASDSTNASVDAATGVVTGVAGGKANITVSYGTLTPVTFEITVKAEAVTKYEMVFGSDNGGYTAPSGQQNSYGGMYDLTLNDLKWKVPGNLSFPEGLKVGGGKNGTANAVLDRAIYSIDKLDANVDNVTVTFGEKDANASCDNVTLKVFNSAADAADGADDKAVSKVTVAFVDNSTVTFARPEGATWNTGYYRFEFPVKNSNTKSNSGIRILKVTFNFVVA